MNDRARLVGSRGDLLANLANRLARDRDAPSIPQVRGIIADSGIRPSMTSASDAKGADAWRASIVTALEDKAGKESLVEHKLVCFLMSDFVYAISELETSKAELGSLIKAGSPKGEAAASTDDAC